MPFGVLILVVGLLVLEDDVQRHIKSPASDATEVQEQLTTLAKAIGALVDQCDDLLASMKWLADNATFPAKGS